VVVAAVDGAIAAAAEDSAASAAEALVVAAQADLGKMNYNMILNIKEPPIGGSFNAYLLS
jgi:hypothetical protein